ncbi:ROK family transcriptional regulator [Priestia megaterium]|uniref:ROK family transcriptional regulator n=1 Tax=Priestia megaterium TaxID=1404 RepID=UPI002730CE8C|nr:ROK family transcriptional regulator [Priestia megaterium]MDP1442104.1 ROK family transcriptional regulator [Priestia megaterium]MDP1471119.1 ROK family transcriptional regulator [Priestia megaterium]
MYTLRNGSKELIKDINRFKVLNLIREKYPISRSEIARLSDLRMSTLTYIIDDLTKQRLTFEVGESSSTGGRRAKLIEFNKNFGVTISVKIEEKRLLIGLTNMEAEIIEVMKISFEKHTKSESIVAILEKKIRLILEKNQKDLSDLQGIGVLSSGLVNRHDGLIIRSSMLGWSNIPIAQMLEDSFTDIPVFVDKNINGYALAELSKGEGKESNNFVLISVGAGLGLSVVIEKKIYYGYFGGAGEFGHTTAQVDGYLCHCGQQGCLEMYASEFYFENKGRELLSYYPNTSLNNFEFEEVAEQAKKGDKLALRLVDEMGCYLGYGIRNIINTLNPEKVVIAGEGIKYSKLFMEQVQKISQDNFFSKLGNKTEVVQSTLKDDAWLIGGALLAINHIFQVPIYE